MRFHSPKARGQPPVRRADHRAMPPLELDLALASLARACGWKRAARYYLAGTWLLAWGASCGVVEWPRPRARA